MNVSEEIERDPNQGKEEKGTSLLEGEKFRIAYRCTSVVGFFFELFTFIVITERIG